MLKPFSEFPFTWDKLLNPPHSQPRFPRTNLCFLLAPTSWLTVSLMCQDPSHSSILLECLAECLTQSYAHNQEPNDNIAPLKAPWSRDGRPMDVSKIEIESTQHYMESFLLLFSCVLFGEQKGISVSVEN